MRIDPQVLRNRILTVLKNNGNKGLSYNQIVVLCSATNSEKKAFKQTLSDMLDSGELIKTAKKISIKSLQNTTSTPLLSDKSSVLIEGNFDATPLAKDLSYAFVKTAEGDYFVSAEDTLNAFHNDIVLIEPMHRKGKQSYCIVRRIIERANEIMAGEVHPYNNALIFVSSNPKIHQWFFLNDISDNLENNKVIFKVTNWGNPGVGAKPRGIVSQVLGKAGDPQVELLAVLIQYRLPLEFSNIVEDAVSSIDDKIDTHTLESRIDLRELFTFTIDPASAKDYDDAISIIKTDSGFKLYVHIADVAHFISPGDPIFEEAVRRGNSFYFPRKVIPMLPERLSNRICSLRPDEDKLCMTVITEFDNQANIRNQFLVESVIRSNFRLIYEDVDKYFDENSPIGSQELMSTLDIAKDLSLKLSTKRNDAGYIYFDLPEIQYQYNEEGFLQSFGMSEETLSHKIIENFMLIANEFVAKQLNLRAPETMYRIHEDPDIDKLDRLFDLLRTYGLKPVLRENLNKTIQVLLAQLADKRFHTVFDRIILRNMKKAKYSSTHQRHFGLSIEYYTHFTSPIRRLCDLVVHHQCKNYICKTSNTRFNTKQLKYYSEQASQREILADDAERDIERTLKLSYFKEKIGQEYRGIVVGTTSSGLIIRLYEVPVTVVLPVSQFVSRGFEYLDKEMRYVNKRNGYYYQLTDEVYVQIMQVTDDIYVELSNRTDNHTHIFEYNRKNETQIGRKRTDKVKTQLKGKQVDGKPRAKKNDKKIDKKYGPRKQ